jgi:SAM-dependent methyltransferase
MPAAGRVDLGLKFLQDVFDLKALHLGLFTEGVPRTPEGIHRAQEEYTKALIGLIPPGVRSVLDVGSGLGGTSRTLAEAGLAVEGLSPDPHHGEQFARTCGSGVPFHLTALEGFSPGRTFDCLLFSESPQYIDKDALFPKCLELTGPGGHLVVAEFFQACPGGPYDTCFFEEDFLARAERAGFRLEHRRDVTEEVLPTLEIGGLFLKYGRRMFNFAAETFRRRRPLLTRLVRLPFGRKIDHIRMLLNDRLPRWLDPELFRRTTRYVMLRMTRQPPAQVES